MSIGTPPKGVSPPAKAPAQQQDKDWQDYPPNPAMEVNRTTGYLRTKNHQPGFAPTKGTL